MKKEHCGQRKENVPVEERSCQAQKATEKSKRVLGAEAGLTGSGQERAGDRPPQEPRNPAHSTRD